MGGKIKSVKIVSHHVKSVLLVNETSTVVYATLGIGIKQAISIKFVVNFVSLRLTPDKMFNYVIVVK